MRQSLPVCRATVDEAGPLLAKLALGPIGDPNSDAPTAADEPATVAEDGSVVVDVRANDADTENDALTVVANWLPFEDPGGGQNFYKFDPRARY